MRVRAQVGRSGWNVGVSGGACEAERRQAHLLVQRHRLAHDVLRAYDLAVGAHQLVLGHEEPGVAQPSRQPGARDRVLLGVAEHLGEPGRCRLVRGAAVVGRVVHGAMVPRGGRRRCGRRGRLGVGVRAYKSHFDEPTNAPLSIANAPMHRGGLSAGAIVQSPLQPAMMELQSQPPHSFPPIVAPTMPAVPEGDVAGVQS